MKQRFYLALIATAATLLSACGGHPYFNTWFNLNRHYEAALRELSLRQDSLPGDTTWLAAPEREHWQKVIEKGAKIHQNWPARKDYESKVLFREGIAHMHLGNWNDCLRSFEDLQRNDPAFDSVPAAEFHKSTCLAKKGENTLALFALNQIASNAQHPYYIQALSALAKLQGSQGRDSLSLLALEKMLAQPGKPSLLLAQAHLQAAKLYDLRSEWKAAFDHYRDSSLTLLPRAQYYGAQLRSALLQQKMGDSVASMKSLEGLAADGRFADSLLTTQFALADLYDALNRGPQAENLLLSITKGKYRGEFLAHAWFALGERERLRTFFFEKALKCYDSAVNVQPRSVWAQLSRQRSAGLKTILAARQPKVEARVAFQASEAYLFQLDQVDSSLHLLQKISEDTAVQSNLRAKALYAQAFLRESVKKDSAESDLLWKNLIQKYPGTEYAKQAQRNLGMDLDQLTESDQAHSLYLRAESLMVRQVPLALLTLDSLVKRYPQSLDAPKALWFKSYSLVAGKQDALARKTLQDLIAQYPNSPYTDYARLALESKAEFDPSLLRSDKELLVGLQRNLNDYREQRAREDKLREQMQAAPKSGSSEEELLWDYNERYGP